MSSNLFEYDLLAQFAPDGKAVSNGNRLVSLLVV